VHGALGEGVSLGVADIFSKPSKSSSTPGRPDAALTPTSPSSKGKRNRLQAR
jgi:hypothetical protein